MLQYNSNKMSLGLVQVATTLLPQIDDISGLIEENNHLFLGDPRLGLE